MSTADQAALEALAQIKYEIRGKHAQGSWAQEYTIRPEAARALLAAVSAGQVPTIYHISQIPGVREYEARYDQDQQRITDLGAEVERLTKVLEDEQKRVTAVMVCHAVLGDEWLGEQLDAEKRPAWADAVDLVRKLKGEREAEKARAEKATALRDQLARLLIEAVATIKATRAENPGQRWSHTLELRMLAAFDSVTHAQLWVRNEIGGGK